MSHYTVGVILKKDDVLKYGVESALARVLSPFDENMEVAPYSSATLEQVKEKYDKLVKVVQEGKSDRYNVDYLKELATKGVFDSLESYIAYEYSHDEEKDEHGIGITTYNPQSKWDWYQIGGRWSGLLDGADYLQIKDLKFKKEATEEETARMTAYYGAITKDKSLWSEEESKAAKGGFIMMKPEYYLRKYPTAESYIDSQLTLSTYALLTPTGEWIEPGEMGWFGLSSATPEQEGQFKNTFMDVVNSADKEDYFVVVDCHI